MQITEWLTAILRFAVTLEECDRTTALTMGGMLDTSGVVGSASFHFFSRTGAQVCYAISERHASESDTVLRRHIDRIDNPRLARSFAAAVGLDSGATRGTSKHRRSRVDLWRGLDEARWRDSCKARSGR
jgi:hypothetical protein